tara:strand:- start:1598 stop:1954 length:357 start_codon:yes stop_codon:yes gene_type:complete
LDNFIIYHNPRCSKSRQSLEILREKEIEPEIIFYLETPPSEEELKSITTKLRINAFELLRKNEKEFKEQDLANPSRTEGEIIQAMVKFPRLIERPIIIKGDRAIIGRPPENVLKIIYE